MAKRHPITNIDDPRWVRAISHPLRIRLLAMLDEDAASPVVLANKLEQPLGTVAYHVRLLYDLGLLTLVSTRQRRGATEHYYRTKDHPRFTDRAWAQLDVVAKQRVLTAVLNEAHEYATRSAAAGGFDAPDAHFTRTPFKLDAQGWTELAAASKRWLEEAADIEHAAAGRLATDPHSGVDVGLVILLFEAFAFSASESPKGEAPATRTGAHQKSARAPKTAQRSSRGPAAPQRASPSGG